MPNIETEHYNLAAYVQGDAQAEKAALVLPGLLDTKDYPHMRGHVDYLASLGFLALSFDMPGIWESGDDITQYTTTNCLQAVDEVITHVNKPVFVLGHSNGGRLASLTAIRNPQVYAMTAIMSAPTFVRESNRVDRTVVWREEGTRMSNRDLPDDPSHSREYRLPYSFCEDAMQYDTRRGLDKLHIPKLFVLGEQDTTVLPAEVEKAYDVAAEPKQLVRFMSDHNYRFHPDLIQKMNTVIGDFITSL